MLKNHQTSIRKSNFFTVIPFLINSNNVISANYTPLPFQNSLEDLSTHRRLRQRSQTCSIRAKTFKSMLSCTKLTIMEKVQSTSQTFKVKKSSMLQCS